jgi:hypothetical protein
VGVMWALCDLMKRGFGDGPLWKKIYGKFWKNGKGECCMKKEECKCCVQIVKLMFIMW